MDVFYIIIIMSSSKQLVCLQPPANRLVVFLPFSFIRLFFLFHPDQVVHCLEDLGSLLLKSTVCSDGTAGELLSLVNR